MIRLVGVATLCLPIWACSAERPGEAPPPAAPTTRAPSSAGSAETIAADLQGLRYLEGDWRGSGYEGGTFYESYRFVNDSTIQMTAWTDSTMTTARERSEYALRDGVVRAGNTGRLVSVDENGHHFRSGSSTWTFRRVSPDRWTAQVSASTTYTMDRIRR